jgi:hypothetical protein
VRKKVLLVKSVSGDESTDDYSSWFHEHRVEVLLLNELVRSRIARYTNSSKPGGVLNEIERAFSSGRDGFLFGVALTGSVLLQRASRMHPGQKRTEEVSWPVGRAIVAVLCSLAIRNQELAEVTQVNDGCTLAAKISLSSFSIPGFLVVGIHGDENGSLIEAETQIPSGIIPWMKSKRILETLHDDIPRFASLDDYL